jgi:hypothetical protein
MTQTEPLNFDLARDAYEGLFRKMEEQVIGLLKEGKYVACSPMYFDRTGDLITGIFLNVKMDYKVVDQDDPIPYGWQLFGPESLTRK